MKILNNGYGRILNKITQMLQGHGVAYDISDCVVEIPLVYAKDFISHLKNIFTNGDWIQPNNTYSTFGTDITIGSYESNYFTEMNCVYIPVNLTTLRLIALSEQK